MSKLKNLLESELEHYEFNTDIEAMKNSEARRKKRRKKVLLSVSSFVFILIVASAVLFTSNHKTNEENTYTNNGHSFFIVASALDAETNEPLVKLTDSKSIPQKDIIIMQIRFACTYYVHGDSELEGCYEMGDKRLDEIFANDNLTINKSFTGMGNNSIWIEGEAIKKVEYTAQNGMIYYLADNIQDKTVTLEGETIYSNDGKVSWLLPEEITTWMEYENTTNKPVDFSRAPQDTITITATYSDGSTATRKLKLYFNQYGYLVIETEDGIKYNDCELNDYKKWKSNVTYNENGEEVAWDYNGRANDE
ncbi:hypothetical protein [Ruminococcus sp.]|uniref:hypothetical protein n=1 Tax=Ruminococcus sp. TaxID=41978 RepID=UPI00388F8654